MSYAPAHPNPLAPQTSSTWATPLRPVVVIGVGVCVRAERGAELQSPAACALTQSLTDALTHSLCLWHSLTHSLTTQSLTHSLTHALTQSLTHSRTHSHTQTRTHALTHLLTRSLTPSHRSLTVTPPTYPAHHHAPSSAGPSKGARSR